jgi:hypothetical protein
LEELESELEDAFNDVLDALEDELDFNLMSCADDPWYCYLAYTFCGYFDQPCVALLVCEFGDKDCWVDNACYGDDFCEDDFN